MMNALFMKRSSSLRLMYQNIALFSSSSSWRVPSESELEERLQFHYARSSGPGGQNVNKVNTKVDARLSLRSAAEWMPSDVLQRLERIARTTVGGELVLQSDRFRTQPQNRADVVRKLRTMLVEASTPEVERIATVVPERVVAQRRAEKQRRSDIKRQRSGPFE
jgi:protein subunit release factor B